MKWPWSKGPVKVRHPIHHVPLISRSQWSSFAAGQSDPMVLNNIENVSMNAALEKDLWVMRSRSRRLARDNDYMIRFLQMVRTNVVGPAGIRLQSRVKDASGKPVEEMNRHLEGEFREWGMRGVPTMNGSMSWVDLQNLAIETVARDGEFLCRIYRGKAAGNEWGLALHPIDIDRLNEIKRDARGVDRGNEIRMGIEMNEFGRPQHYWIRTTHPGDWGSQPRPGRSEYERVPASDVIHLYIPQRPEQIRGVPWAHTTIRRMEMLGGYEEAELIAARVGASKMGILVSPDGDVESERKDDFFFDATPGSFDIMPDGYDLKAWDPQHPNASFKDFEKAVLRGIASGLRVSYVSLANDLEGANYSSLRHGLTDERDYWRTLQRWMSESFHTRVWREWTHLAALSGRLDPYGTMVREMDKVEWQPRGWAWIDPKVESEANAKAHELRVKSRTEIAGERGQDIEDVMLEIQAEDERLKELGIETSGDSAEQSNGPQNDGGDGDDGKDTGDGQDDGTDG